VSIGRRLGASAGRKSGGGASGGQATVELAVALPLVVTLLLLVVQVGLVVRDQLLVVHAAREAARTAAVSRGGDAPAAAAARAGPLDAAALDTEIVEVPGHPRLVRVHVRYRCRTDVPLIGALVPDLVLEATAVMSREG
jgi:Flp pilus assembly protein TadG